MSTKEKQTLKKGFEFAANLSDGSIILLDGELAAGKSVFARGVANGLGVKGDILSPTFTIMNNYDLASGLTLCHIDAYRIKNIDEAYEAGLEEFIGSSDTICLIEWSSNIKEFLVGKKTTLIKFEIVDENTRRIEIT